MNEQSVKTCLGCGKTKPLSSYWKNGRYGMHPRCKECMGYQGPKSEDEQKDRLKRRFWSKVDKDGPVVREELGPCWVWTGSKHKFGYGYFRFHGKTDYSHRVSWFLEHGSMPTERCALHKCDNPSCVRPDHLFEGSDADNMRDKTEKGRGYAPCLKGEEHGMAKLTPEDIREIRRLWDSGCCQADISKQFKISRVHASRIGNRKSWTHIPERDS